MKSKTETQSKWMCPLCNKPLHTPVVSECGHIYCWPCICKHLQESNTCPICDKVLNKENLIPIYGQTDESKEDAPPPPKQQRVEPPKEEEIRRQNVFPGFRNETNFQFRFLPFGFGFTATFGNMYPGNVFPRQNENQNQNNNNNNNNNNNIYGPNQFMPFIVLFFIMVVISFLI